jgi:hypothetical protein
MARNIVNKPHLTPNPDKSHTPAPSERGSDPAAVRRPTPNPYAPPGHEADPGSDAADEEPTYDSCFDDLNVILSQSIQKPDPDPNLESPSGTAIRGPRDEAAPHVQQERGRTPRTSEIFRTVVSPTVGMPTLPQAGSHQETGPAPESTMPDVVLDRERHIQDLASEEEDRLSDPQVTWSHVLLMSYSSAITLAMIWMLWTGRWTKDAAPSPADPEPAAPEPSSQALESAPVTPAPRIPAENLTALGKTIRIGDLEVTPLSVTAAPVQLRRSIQPDKGRREETSLILRMKLTNVSKEYAFAPLDQILVRERGVRPFDPYIETSEGTAIRLFPLAIDSEWSIVGQEFATLQPGDSEETFVVAEPGAAQKLADAMTWRVRLRTGVYRLDMLGVQFRKDDVGRPRVVGSAGDEQTPP